MRVFRSLNRGVTILELLVVLMILSLILTAAVKTWDVTLERSRFESAQRKLSQLATAIVGNPDQIVAGRRVDFGFAGDMGRLPLNLTELVVNPNPGLQPDSNPWRGPYVRATFNESPDGFRIDGWGDTIVYDRDSLFVRSHGGSTTDRSKWITRSLRHTRNELLNNEVAGGMLDVNGLPPNPADSVTKYLLRFGVELEYPIAGLMQKLPVSIDVNGRFQFTSVPQGTHLLRAYYWHETPPEWAETTLKQVTVYPGVGARDLEVRLNLDWNHSW